jgi:4-azaleucine resistance transporter AzlC
MNRLPRARTAGSVFAHAFVTTIPVLLGYIAIGVAFGMLLVHAGYPIFLAPVMSVLIYAGAAQYLAVGLFAAGAGLAETAAVTLLVNSRHMMYGLSLLDRFSSAGRFKPYLIFALTDETYALLTSVKIPAGVDASRFCFYVSALDQSYWVIGSTLGAILGSILPFSTEGLDFALTALFVVLLIEQFRVNAWKLPFGLAAAAGVAVLLTLGTENMLVFSLLGATVLLLAFKSRAPKAAAERPDVGQADTVRGDAREDASC